MVRCFIQTIFRHSFGPGVVCCFIGSRFHVFTLRILGHVPRLTQNPRVVARTRSAWTHPLADRLSHPGPPAGGHANKYVACYPPRFRSVPLVGSPAHSCFRVAPPRFQEAQAPTAIARMCSAARCLSNCGPSFKGLVAARLCDAAHCLCNQGLFSIPILLLLLALLPLQALALVTHASAPGVGTSALKNG